MRSGYATETGRRLDSNDWRIRYKYREYIGRIGDVTCEYMI